MFSNGSFKYRRLYFGGVVSDVGSVFMILMFEGMCIFVFVLNLGLGFLGLGCSINLSVSFVGGGVGEGVGRGGGGIVGYV